ncbi:hypothetical protein ACJIZ3_010791 [Penstemon smallii]|uniref:Wound-responsive family protein n=1 Tax=Penstemon smallii TaxID=265156 RepID=A0ABD3UHA9_9LAMI
MNSSTSFKIVAASMGAVEALKDQFGFCRWNYALRSTHHLAKKNMITSFSKAKQNLFLPESSAVAVISNNFKGNDEKAKMAEESLRKVMYLSCWGPN